MAASLSLSALLPVVWVAALLFATTSIACIIVRCQRVIVCIVVCVVVCSIIIYGIIVCIAVVCPIVVCIAEVGGGEAVSNCVVARCLLHDGVVCIVVHCLRHGIGVSGCVVCVCFVLHCLHCGVIDHLLSALWSQRLRLHCRHLLCCPSSASWRCFTHCCLSSASWGCCLWRYHLHHHCLCVANVLSNHLMKW